MGETPGDDPRPAPLPLRTTPDDLTVRIIPPAQPGPAPRIVGALPQLAGEVQALLHQRLRLLCLLFVIAWGWSGRTSSSACG